MERKIQYGLKGWYWTMPNGRLGMIYGPKETLVYLDPSLEGEIRKFLQFSEPLQKELEEYHIYKFSKTPKTAPLTSRQYKGKLTQILLSSTPASP